MSEVIIGGFGDVKAQDAERNAGWLVSELHRFVALSKEKPYLSYWGEFFFIFYQLKKIGQAVRKDMMLYELAAGTMKYVYEKNRFVVMLPDMNIVLEDHEAADALCKGKLAPSPRIETPKP